MTLTGRLVPELAFQLKALFENNLNYGTKNLGPGRGCFG
jgi:hypothetical protein